jgi:hypothetical protein
MSNEATMELKRILPLLAVQIFIGGAVVHDILTRTSVELVMGAWSTGNFDNDDALDFLVRLEGAGADAVRQALEEVEGSGIQDYVQVDSAAAAIAAAELVAAALDGQTSQLPETAREWLDENRKSIATSSMQALARRAVERVLMKSELKDLWTEGGASAQSAAWENGVRELLKRL